MLFHSSLRKELARSFGATLVILATVIMTMMLIRTLGQASKGSVNPSDVMLVMAYTVMGHLPTILTLSLFIAIVSSLSRMYLDSEMVIWFSSGQSLGRFMSPLLRFSWVILLAVAALALVGWPWSNQQIQELRQKYEKRGDLDRIAPGQFQESADGSRVFFIDKNSPDLHTGNNIFVASTTQSREAITLANNARIENVGEDRFIMLNNGQRVEKNLPNGDVKISDFESYGTRIQQNSLGDANQTPVKTISTLDLWRNPIPLHLGELSWRLGLALAAFNFVVLALSMSVVNPRAGRTGNLALALFTFIVYFNLINLGQSWISSSVIPMSYFMLALHGGILLFGLLLLSKRHSNWSFTYFWKTIKSLLLKSAIKKQQLINDK